MHVTPPAGWKLIHESENQLIGQPIHPCLQLRCH